MSELGPSDPPDGGATVAALVWQAMRQAADVPEESTGATVVAADDDIAERLPMLWDAVWRAASGGEPHLPAPSLQSRRLLDRVRRSFIELVRTTLHESVAVGEVVRVLDALERVQAAIDRDAALDFKERLAGPGGLDLVIEVAHDLRSPLTSILYLAETLRAGQSGPLRPIQERQLALIYGAAFELSSLANDLTELARGGEQLLEREPIPFSIESLLLSVCDIVQPIAEEKGLEVRVARDGVDHRLGHPAALGRVLLNLVTNALKYSDQGFVEASARDLSPARMEFTVRDSGPGMPTEVVSQLLEPFHRGLGTRERGFSSSGLGLAICRRLVTAMGGELRVKTAPARGSCFYFDLPLPAAELEPMLEAAGDAAGDVPDFSRWESPVRTTRRPK